MLKHIILFALAILATPVLADQLPADFTITEDFSVFQASMSVQAGETNLGTITKDVFSLTTNFTLIKESTKLERAEEQFLTWGHQSKVYDGNGTYIGMIKEEIFTSFFRQYNQYTLFNAAGAVVGTSQKQGLFSTNIVITNPSGATIGTISRARFTLLDVWDVHVDREAIDPRLILFIAAYKTDSDNHKHK